jgi:Protein of unknown function (DUF4013)
MASAASAPSGSIDFARCFTFVTEDPEWIVKILVGGLFALLSMVLVGLPFVFGYVARTLKRVAAGESRPLPSWDDLGGIFGDGLRVFGVQIVYSLGVAAVVLAPMCLVGAGAVAMGTTAERVPGSEDVMGAVGGLGLLAFWALAMVGGLALAVYLPAALVRTVMRESFAEGFNFGANVAFIRANIGNYALSVVAYIVAAFVAQFGVILCFVGLFPATFWAYLVATHGLGQTIRLNPASV